MSQDPILLGTREPFGYSEGERRAVCPRPSAAHVHYRRKRLRKTHLLRNILIQMIARGDGVGILDPHGDVSEELRYPTGAHPRRVLFQSR